MAIRTRHTDHRAANGELMAKWLARVFALATVGCLAAAGYLAFRRSAPEPPLEVRSTDQDLGQVPLGTRDVTISVHNPSRYPHRIIDAGGVCTGTCCVSLTHPDPITIAPGETAYISCELKVAVPGPFKVEFPVFLDENGLQKVMVIVRGVGVAPAGRTNDPPKP